VILANVLTLGSSATIGAQQFISKVDPTNRGGGVVAVIANQILMANGSRISADHAGFSGGVPAQ